MGTIKSFKKFIEESIWSDIQDRSMGKTVRKEDEYDIDEKELERSVDTCIKTYVIGFIYYDKYDGSSDTFLKYIQEWNRNICQNAQLYDRRFGKYVEPIKVIPSYVKKNWETGKSYKSLVDKKMSEEEKKVKDTGFIKKPGESISDTLSKWFDENFEKLGDDFCEEIEEYNERYHNEGGSMSVDLGVEDWWDDLEYIEQVEIYQDYMKKTNESIWSDIQDRSMGKTVRKEDDINLLDKDGLYEYLISHYKPIENIDIKSCISCGKSHISLCVFIYPKQTVYSILLDILNCRVKVGTPYIKRWPTNLLDMIDKKYYREDVIDSNRDHMTFITPKEGKGNNQFYIDFLDMILNNVDKPFLKKVINESIWSDIQDRSMGKTVRKEDDVNFLDIDGLYEYIKSKYEKYVFYLDKTWYNEIYVDVLTNISLILKPNGNGGLLHVLLSWSKEKISMPFFDKLSERFKVENPSVNRRIITEKDGTCTNQTYIDVIDFFLDNIDNMLVNESVWTDMQKRSSGDEIRKEDCNLTLLNHYAKMFKNAVDVCSDPRNPVTLHYDDTCDDFVKYLDRRRGEHLDKIGSKLISDKTYFNMMKYVKNYWGDCKGIKEFIDKYLGGLNECEGVPGGATPANVGGMGTAYFPGPNGEPGSGDLPSPTGIVYHQVAPYTMFLKQTKKKKKKKKKFRKEDEPCVHSENPPIYSHVDDFRDYVDRTYDNIDKKK